MRTDEQIFKEVVEKAIENGFMKGLSVTYEINPRNVVFYNKKTNMRLGLGCLAWHELVSTAETTLPILVLEDDKNTVITGAIKIRDYLLLLPEPIEND